MNYFFSIYLMLPAALGLGIYSTLLSKVTALTAVSSGRTRNLRYKHQYISPREIAKAYIKDVAGTLMEGIET
jgi:hypothetical protein